MQHKFNSLKSALIRESANFGFFILVLIVVGYLSESLMGAITKVLLLTLGGVWLFLVDAYVIVFIDDTSVTFYYPFRPWRRNTKLSFDEINTIKEGYRNTFIINYYTGKEIYFSHAFFPSEVKKILGILKQQMGSLY